MNEPQLEAAFAAFRAETMPHVKAAGIEQARATVSHRRMVRAVSLASLAVILTLMPISFYAWHRTTLPDRIGNTPTVVPTPSNVVPTPSPSDTTEPGPSPTPPDTRPRCDQPHPGLVVPPGGISLDELCNASVTLQVWSSASCPSGKVRFTDGVHFIAASFFLNLGSSTLVSDADLSYADVDRDGHVETLLLLSCGGEGWISKVVALRRTSDGIGTFAEVVATGGEIKRLISVRGNADGTVTVEVADWNGGLGDDGSLAQRQSRTYGFSAGQFRQVGGPTSFPINPKVTDLKLVSATNLAFGPATGGSRSGSLTATVRNVGPSPAPYLLSFDLPAYAELSPVPPGCRIETSPQPVITVFCDRPALAAGATESIMLNLHAPANANSVVLDFLPYVRALIANGYGDPRFDNNDLEFAITFA